MALRKHISAYALQRFRVTTLVWVRESVMCLTERLNAEGVRVEAIGSGQHALCPESKIRVVKERVSCIVNTLPYKLPKSLIESLVSYFVSTRLDTGGVSSPKAVYLGRLLDMKVDARIGFGEYVQVKTVHQTGNSKEPRAVGAIALKVAENLWGSVRSSPRQYLSEISGPACPCLSKRLRR